MVFKDCYKACVRSIASEEVETGEGGIGVWYVERADETSEDTKTGEEEEK